MTKQNIPQGAVSVIPGILGLTYKKIEAENNGDKDGEAWYNLSSSAVYGRTMENLRNRIVRLVSNNKRLFKMDIKTKLYVTRNF